MCVCCESVHLQIFDMWLFFFWLCVEPQTEVSVFFVNTFSDTAVLRFPVFFPCKCRFLSFVPLFCFHTKHNHKFAVIWLPTFGVLWCGSSAACALTVGWRHNGLLIRNKEITFIYCLSLSCEGATELNSQIKCLSQTFLGWVSDRKNLNLNSYSELPVS